MFYLFYGKISKGSGIASQVMQMLHVLNYGTHACFSYCKNSKLKWTVKNLCNFNGPFKNLGLSARWPYYSEI